MYRCVTRNKFGSVSKQLNLTVIGKLLNKLQSNLIHVFALLELNFVKSTPMCIDGLFFACNFSADGGYQSKINNGKSANYAMS